MNPISIKPTAQGKVRDIYDLGDALLLVATDRISAFDYILEDEIPCKGQVLTQISCFWFELLEGVVENHLISSRVEDLPEAFKPWEDYLRGRIMIVKKAQMYPLECVVRGYLAGSGYKDYLATGQVCGIKLPAGLRNAEKLDAPLFTPSTKAAVGDHDEEISFEGALELIGEDARTLRDLSFKLYETASDYARRRGIIIGDTKFEFGNVDGKIILGDEALTPDSSRFWAVDTYEPGRSQESFDKQFVRNWLDANWDRTGCPPRLPQDVISATTEKYIQAYELLTGRTFQ